MSMGIIHSDDKHRNPRIALPRVGRARHAATIVSAAGAVHDSAQSMQSLSGPRTNRELSRIGVGVKMRILVRVAQRTRTSVHRLSEADYSPNTGNSSSPGSPGSVGPSGGR